MAPTLVTAIDGRRNAVSRIENQSVQDQTVSGRNLFNGIGAVSFTVKFPVTFAGRPIYSSGADLDVQTPFDPFASPIPPEVTSLVVAWEARNAVPGAFEGYHTGATIVAVIRGLKEQLTWINWTFHGPALRNPI